MTIEQPNAKKTGYQVKYKATISTDAANIICQCKMSFR